MATRRVSVERTLDAGKGAEFLTGLVWVSRWRRDRHRFSAWLRVLRVLTRFTPGWGKPRWALTPAFNRHRKIDEAT
jgi:hypothetical protein